MKISPKDALQQLAEHTSPFKQLFNHGSLEVEVYKPEQIDLQEVHDKDEIYVIISGTGKFKNGQQHMPFAPGDFLFVPAGIDHRFYDFTDDFATWVFFYGPKGGGQPHSE